jgi:lysyl-tRNA synthetase class II
MEYSRESQDRIKKIQALKDADIIPYANRFENKQDISDIKSISANDTQ